MAPLYELALAIENLYLTHMQPPYIKMPAVTSVASQKRLMP